MSTYVQAKIAILGFRVGGFPGTHTQREREIEREGGGGRERERDRERDREREREGAHLSLRRGTMA